MYSRVEKYTPELCFMDSDYLAWAGLLGWVPRLVATHLLKTLNNYTTAKFATRVREIAKIQIEPVWFKITRLGTQGVYCRHNLGILSTASRKRRLCFISSTCTKINLSHSPAAPIFILAHWLACNDMHHCKVMKWWSILICSLRHNKLILQHQMHNSKLIVI